ncbi:hypothetical protein N7463_002028 [Penicillium fimorum]|uniref:Cupin type-1 domain-containing protein n=1 Tax=Penicillium fimorum TaxID=1882269 RepID=A0A9W9XYA3_9EURO|nr:hypothetical protein N7463_002028 [Penicillium fimorum]
MVAEVRQYHLFPTNLIPNSPRPLLRYKNVLVKDFDAPHYNPGKVWEMFTKNEWDVQWIFRYSDTQLSHYHSKAHECMAVLSGTASIQFGVADTSQDMQENTYNSAWEEGDILLEAEAGDVFIIPAGVAHKTYNTRPKADFTLLSPGNGHGIEAEDPKKALSEIKLDGFTMMGAYNGGDWDFITTGGNFEKVWGVPKPKYDPVYGSEATGLCKRWYGSNRPPTYEPGYEVVETGLRKRWHGSNRPPKARL